MLASAILPEKTYGNLKIGFVKRFPFAPPSRKLVNLDFAQ